MPTIEIASINSSGLHLNQNDFDVAIREESVLKSHRGLFYDFLLKFKGTIIHIGNPEYKSEKEGFFFGGSLINWDFEPTQIYIPDMDSESSLIDTGANQIFKFQFQIKYKYDIDRILNIALQSSPIKRVFFLTDYQFGPENELHEIIYSITAFWNLHDTDGLWLNRLYVIYKR